MRAPGSPEAVARDFIDANGELLGTNGLGRSLRTARVLHSLGATHVIVQQRHRALRVHRAYVTIHMDRNGAVYLAKNRAMPRSLLPPRGTPRFGDEAARAKAASMVSGPRGRLKVTGTELLWYPLRDRLALAYRVRIRQTSERADWMIHLDAQSGELLSQTNLLAKARGRAKVFWPNPVVALGDWRGLLTPNGKPGTPPDAAYRRVWLSGLDGSGFLRGQKVSACAGRAPARRKDRRFEFRSGELGFAEVMAYHQIDRAVRHVEAIGYRGKRAVLETPLSVDAHYSREDNSWYDPDSRSLGFGIGGVNDAEDGELVLHEFGHALQDAICPGFGQSHEASAIGEGFADFFSACYWLDAKERHAELVPALMSWDAVASGGAPPCVRRMDSTKTYADFRARANREHENGLIWSAALWECRAALGRQWAERVVIDSLFQLDAFASVSQAARALIDSDRNLCGGRHRRALERIFAGRRVSIA